MKAYLLMSLLVFSGTLVQQSIYIVQVYVQLLKCIV